MKTIPFTIKLVFAALCFASLTGFAKEICDDGDPVEMKASLETIRGIAYASDGLNLSSTDASQFAARWMVKFPCDAATPYSKIIKQLRSMAYAPDGFNLSSTDASALAQDWVNRVCDLSVDFQAKARTYYQVAYSPTGLNLSSTEASKYARAKMEKKYFTCANGSAFWE